MRFVKIEAGLYAVEGTPYAVGRTEDWIEGPCGGSYAAWELRRWDDRFGWVIDDGYMQATLTLREMRQYIEAHPETVGLS